MSELTNLHDEHGNPVASDQRPPDVTALPFLEAGILPGALPEDVEARALRGNWYGRGDEVVLWHVRRQRHVNFPVNDAATQYEPALRALRGYTRRSSRASR